MSISPSALRGITLLALCGCASDGSVAGERETNAPITLQLVPSETALETAPASAGISPIVSSSGEVVHRVRLASGHSIALFDSAGRMLQEFGVRGQGPGEVMSPMPVRVTDSSVTVFDMQAMRITEWRRDGSIIQVRPLTVPVRPVAAVGTRWLALQNMPGGGIPILFDGADGGATAQPLAKSPFLDSLLAGTPGGPPTAVLGSWGNGVIVGDGMAYRIGFFDSTGTLVRRVERSLGDNLRTEAQIATEIETARAAAVSAGKPLDAVAVGKLEAGLRTPQPWFWHVTPLQVDGAGRLWVVGQTRDSVFADVFDTAGGVERHWLECPGFSDGWSVNAGWLALVCAAPEAAEYAAVVKRYRILARP